MKKLLVLLALTLLSSCTGTETYVRGEYAFGVPFAGAKLRNDQKTGIRGNGEPEGALPMNGHYISAKFGIRKEIYENVDLSVDAGPALFVPTKGPSEEYISVEATPRLAYKGWPIRPYIEVIAGAGFSDNKKWEWEGTQYLFSIGAGAGVSIPLNKQWEMNVGYRMYHVSNGTKLFGSKSPNVGYNTDLLMIGLQYNF